MKALKLIIIGLVALGALVGIFYLINPTTKTIILPPVDDETFENYSQEFQNDWEGVGDWDENVFNRHRETLNMLSTDYSVEELVNFERSKVTEIVSQKIFAEWDKSDCDKKVIDKYIKAVETIISKYGDDAKSDPDIQQIKSVNSTYRSALDLAGKKIGLTPTFNGSTWNSYTDYSNKIKKQKNDILGNSNYKEYLKNITAISSRLAKIDSELKDGRTRFYQDLADKIYNYYNKIARDKRTRDQLVKLRKARDNYSKEYGSNNKINTLAKNFAADVDANETRAAQEAQQNTDF